MLRKLILMAAAFGLAAKTTQWLAAQGRITTAKQKRGDEREALRTWEDEGGNLKPHAPNA
jgi:hypothetical protein